MEIIRCKHASFMDASVLAAQVKDYDSLHIDIGTGDGQLVRHTAQICPHTFVIGIDACRENLYDVSRRAPSNALFVIANALSLPPELDGLAAGITINFPWGSLLAGLLANDGALLEGLTRLARPNAALEVRLNGGALAEAGWLFEEGANRVHEVLALNGFVVRSPAMLTARDLKSLPTTWAKRLAYGRDPRAIYLRAALKAEQIYRTEHLTAVIG